MYCTTHVYQYSRMRWGYRSVFNIPLLSPLVIFNYSPRDNSIFHHLPHLFRRNGIVCTRESRTWTLSAFVTDVSLAPLPLRSWMCAVIFDFRRCHPCAIRRMRRCDWRVKVAFPQLSTNCRDRCKNVDRNLFQREGIMERAKNLVLLWSRLLKTHCGVAVRALGRWGLRQPSRLNEQPIRRCDRLKMFREFFLMGRLKKEIWGSSPQC